ALMFADAVIRLEVDDRVGARQAYQRALSAPGRPGRVARVGVAHVHFLQGEFAEAHSDLDQLGPLRRCDLAPRRPRARLLLAEERWAEAASAFGELRAATPRGASARSARAQAARCLYCAGRHDDAARVYEQISAETVDDRFTVLARRMAERLRDPARRS